MNEAMQTLERWRGIIRFKASELEHPARKRGEEPAQPSLDAVANEMEAFISALKTFNNDT